MNTIYTAGQKLAAAKADALMRNFPEVLQQVFGGYFEWKDELGRWQPCVSHYPQNDANAMNAVVMECLKWMPIADYAAELRGLLSDTDYAAGQVSPQHKADAILNATGWMPTP